MPAICDVAIIGAGPFGLSLAAHLRDLGIDYRIFGPPMETWRTHMPDGMSLKSDGFASNLYHPRGLCTLKEFCAERGIPYADLGKPIARETFTAYGQWFQQRLLPDLDPRLVSYLGDDGQGGFRLETGDGYRLQARRVVLAVGITHFPYTPAALSDLPGELLTHSHANPRLDTFRGREVAVIGRGASATDLAALLHESGASVSLVTREPPVFHDGPGDQPPSLWWRIRNPNYGLGPNLRSAIYTLFPGGFRMLPARLRLRIVHRHLGPAGGWFMRDRVIGKVKVLSGMRLLSARASAGRALLQMSDGSGTTRELSVDHVIAATGYHPEVERLGFVDPALRARINTVGGAPDLSSRFETSVSGLYCIGPAAANCFGPVMRFAVGADYTMRRITVALARTAARPASGTQDQPAPLGN